MNHWTLAFLSFSPETSTFIDLSVAFPKNFVCYPSSPSHSQPISFLSLHNIRNFEILAEKLISEQNHGFRIDPLSLYVSLSLSFGFTYCVESYTIEAEGSSFFPFCSPFSRRVEYLVFS